MSLDFRSLTLTYCQSSSKTLMPFISIASRTLGATSISQLEENLADIKKGPLAKELVDAMESAGQVLKQ